MPLNDPTPADSVPSAGVSPATGRPLFVPASLNGVRTGPTSAAELERLLADADGAPELSGIRLRSVPSPRRSLWLRLLFALGFAPARGR
jgi:hypothetical protein